MNVQATTEEFAATLPAGVYGEKVLSVQHYTDRLFRFTMTRPDGFRFRSGEFAMIGLMVDGKPIYRAYSIASPSWAEELEFFSIKVPGGPLTQHLQNIQEGDIVLMRKKPTGTLVLDALTPAKRLYMFSTGTGIAPFASLIREPETYEKFDEVILTHTCREVAELQYGFDLLSEIHNDELLSEVVGDKLTHYASVTREPFERTGRITDLISSGKLFDDLGLPPLNPETDRGMICGSAAMLKDTKALLEAAGMDEGANNKPSEFVIERAFVG
ncbi:ferredoxin--NADP reductase [Martelella lutilitoris]|uniref:ferredoxin--NADP(+) reductase n=1 Tax=Martelella lutilitoris TaxID=2583532 RepID=A0A7T7KMZ9_9HYPH|nr:ferredoxin--NADP reductase [Martelella lutilitoris]QQM32327.1 ferredoxin--NADP reductase [Martelella lutilitoris]